MNYNCLNVINESLIPEHLIMRGQRLEVMNLSQTVALESTVIAHGLPWPHNLETAMAMEEDVRKSGSIPKTIGIVKGEVRIGLSAEEVKLLAQSNDVMKVGTAEIAVATALGKNAATTVSGTMALASRSGIHVFATGGLGGVHRDIPWDVSQDIIELSRTGMIVVSSGVKSILDVERTLEFLETFQVTVLGYQTEYFPLFHTRTSHYKVMRIDSPEDIVSVYKHKQKLGIPGAVLIANPVPEVDEIPAEELKIYVDTAISDATRLGINGKALTPYLLGRLGELSGGRTMITNISLLRNNAVLAGEIAAAFGD